MSVSLQTHSKINLIINNRLGQSIDGKNYELLNELFDYKPTENIKCYIASAFRDYQLKNVFAKGDVDLEKVTDLVKISIEGVRNEICLPTLPVLLLSDAFDCIPIHQCEELFEFVENNVSIWKENIFFAHCKNQVLRMCNDVLRRLSRSQNTVFCGRILLLVARFFPFSERSGLNLISEFNLDNLTTFTDSDVMDIDVKSEVEINIKDSAARPSLDYTLYTKFWALQDFFRNPAQCFKLPPWKLFTKYADDIMEAFQSFKLDSLQNEKSLYDSLSNDKSQQQILPQEEDQYFPKYLTNQKLLDLQFSDSNFRRYILVQMLILTQYLTSNIKFKQEVLTEDQTKWVTETREKVFSLLAETPSNGKQFVEIAKAIFKREEVWSEWKNLGCPEIKKPGLSQKRKSNDTDQNGQAEDADISLQPKKKERRKLGAMIRDADSKKKFVMGNPEMTRLWNLCPDNIGACRQECRDFVPSLETYFSNAMEQLKAAPQEPIKEVSESSFGWRGLRLLASKSPHFFTNFGNSIATLPEYLTNMIKKLAKDMPQPQVEGEEVTPKEEEEDKEEVEVMATDVKESVEEVDDDDSAQRADSEPIDVDLRLRLADALAQEPADAWKDLGRKIGFEDDELIYFETEEAKSVKEAIKVMFDRWVENENDKANQDALIFMLEGLKMNTVIQKVFALKGSKDGD